MTIVTGLFDIGREDWHLFSRSYSNYLTYMEKWLQLDVNVVVFVEQKVDASCRAPGRRHLRSGARATVVLCPAAVAMK